MTTFVLVDKKVDIEKQKSYFLDNLPPHLKPLQLKVHNIKLIFPQNVQPLAWISRGRAYQVNQIYVP